ncbi:MAG: hypothetical protein AB1589_21200 [Cyanobacteriota bacterium]
MSVTQLLLSSTQTPRKNGYELTDCNWRELDFIGSREIGNLLVIKGIISWWQEVQYQ